MFLPSTGCYSAYSPGEGADECIDLATIPVTLPPGSSTVIASYFCQGPWLTPLPIGLDPDPARHHPERRRLRYPFPAAGSRHCARAEYWSGSGTLGTQFQRPKFYAVRL